ncbi:hypothetical protein AMTR_s05733p00001060 [Amborella trichopoda]|uniref:Uncharacterized protein n=1 Tax=Amborella trichopoda TaxID=13333 RepID=U5CX66_AMBTC|nr:hypothetical protein AMTR_s05733p00001060 [Amborella trichopoda]
MLACLGDLGHEGAEGVEPVIELLPPLPLSHQVLRLVFFLPDLPFCSSSSSLQSETESPLRSPSCFTCDEDDDDLRLGKEIGGLIMSSESMESAEPSKRTLLFLSCCWPYDPQSEGEGTLVHGGILPAAERFVVVVVSVGDWGSKLWWGPAKLSAEKWKGISLMAEEEEEEEEIIIASCLCCCCQDSLWRRWSGRQLSGQASETLCSSITNSITS